MDFSILVVNYNTEKHIANLLEKLSKQITLGFLWQVIVVNNCQNGILAQTLQPFFDIMDLTLIESDRNIGFGRAMNLAAKHAKGEHLLIINPDIDIHHQEFLANIKMYLNNYPNYGVATCRILNHLGKDTSEFYHYEFDGYLPNLIENKNDIAWFLGALLIIRSEVYHQLNGFDSDFFMYCEDEDLCIRIKKLGLPLIKINELFVYHEGGVSEPVKEYDYFYRWYRSRVLFASKHYSEEFFQTLMHDMYKKSTKKYQQYKLLRYLGSNRFKHKAHQWKAMQDITLRVKEQGTDWLPFY